MYIVQPNQTPQHGDIADGTLLQTEARVSTLPVGTAPSSRSCRPNSSPAVLLQPHGVEGQTLPRDIADRAPHNRSQVPGYLAGTASSSWSRSQNSSCCQPGTRCPTALPYQWWGPSAPSVTFNSNTWIEQSNKSRYDSPAPWGIIAALQEAQPCLQGQLFGLLIWRWNLELVDCSNLYSVLITPTEVPLESSTATITIQMLVSSVPPAPPLLSIAARNFHQHLDNLDHPNVGRLVP